MAVKGLIEDLLRSNAMNYEEGRLDILGIPGVVIPAPTYVKLLEEIVERTDTDLMEMLFETGKYHGKIAVDDVGRGNKTTRRQFVEQAINTGNVMGMGELKVEKYEPEGILLVSITDSPLNEFFKKSDSLPDDQVIHYFFRGVMHSISENLFDSEIKSSEEKCQNLGDEKCVIKCEIL